MAKKSRKVAARYSELGRAGKKKQRDKRSLPTGTVSAPKSQEIPEPRPVKSPVSKTALRRQPELKRAIPGYQYVRADLKRIGMLAGMMIVILIVVAFILG